MEAVAGVALLLVLPRRARGIAAALAGAVLGLLTLLKVFDMGFLSVLERPFDPVFDWTLFDDAREFVAGSFGPAAAVGAVVAAVVLALAVVVLMTLAALRLSRLVDRHRSAATRGVAVLGVAWLPCLALGAQLARPSRSPPAAPRRWPTRQATAGAGEPGRRAAFAAESPSTPSAASRTPTC